MAIAGRKRQSEASKEKPPMPGHRGLASADKTETDQKERSMRSFVV